MRTLVKMAMIASFLIFCSIDSYSQDTSSGKWIPILSKHAIQLGITVEDIKTAQISQQTDEQTGISFLYLQQTWQEVKVFNAIITVAFKNNRLLYSSGHFIKGMATQAQKITGVIAPTDAVRSALKHLNLESKGPIRVRADRFATDKKVIISGDSFARRDVEVEQYWHAADKKNPVLVWNVSIDDRYSDDWWQVRVNAKTGEYVDKNNYTVYESLGQPQLLSNKKNKIEHYWNSGAADQQQLPDSNTHNTTQKPFVVQQASYQIIPYPAESPYAGSHNLVIDPWTAFGTGNPATTLGWHSSETTNFNTTRGNNVFAYMGTKPTDISDPVYNWPDTTNLPGSRLYFLQIPDYNLMADDSVNRTNKKFGLDNLFYWNNMLHDLTYQYGFTEQFKNFQDDNMGRASGENDYVLAQSQDGHGFNNANFSTPPDGQNGRMRMYLFNTYDTYFTINESFGKVRYDAMENQFYSPNKLYTTGTVTGDVALYNDDSAGTIHHGCQPATNDLHGKVVLVDSEGGPGCPDFAYIAANCQNAGAIGVIVYSAFEGVFSPPGADTALKIPLIVIFNSTGQQIISRLGNGETVNVTLAPYFRDASLDNGIVAHEYMHGVSNRLTGGNVNCLNNAEQAGEGWSDYLALMATTDWNHANLTDGALARGIGTYASGQAPNDRGIRHYPYSTDMTINPLNYGHIPLDPEAHAIGEIWCSALWDMTWEIIQQKGSPLGGFLNKSGTGGNVIAMQLVMLGMKLQPCNPGFIDARDAILKADSILYNKQYHCAIWRAFARRGMGAYANQGSSNETDDQKVSFDLPASILAIRDSVIYSGANITIVHSVTPTCQTMSGYFVRDTIPFGFSFISSEPAGELQSGGILHYPAMNFLAGETKTFSITLVATGQGCVPDTVLNDNRDGMTQGNLTPNIEYGATAGWTVQPGGRTGNVWHAQEAGELTVINLVADPTACANNKDLSILSFWHQYDTEYGFDGGVLEYSLDGIDWIDLDPYIIKNGYDALMSGAVFTNRGTFTGSSIGYKQTMVDLTDFANQPIRIRFRFASDYFLGGNGWWVDDILRVNTCGGRLRTGFYPSYFAEPTTETVTNLHIVPLSTLPLKLVSFHARESGSSDLLEWETHSELNVKEFEIEFSTDGQTWKSLGMVPAKNGSVNHYNYVNQSPVNAVNYYRLKMKDNDGIFTYSQVQVVRRQAENFFTLYPNPVQQTARFHFSTSMRVSTIRIFDASGRMLKQQTINPGSTYQEINLSDLSAGVYVAEANGQGGKKVIRFVVE